MGGELRCELQQLPGMQRIEAATLQLGRKLGRLLIALE
jgi:hypothetical protein